MYIQQHLPMQQKYSKRKDMGITCSLHTYIHVYIYIIIIYMYYLALSRQIMLHTALMHNGFDVK